MSSPARASASPSERRDPSDLASAYGIEAGAVDRVVALFSDAIAGPASDEEDWSASLVAVRGVAARVRAMQTEARDAVRDARRSVREAETAARAAEDRAHHAEAALKAAMARADRAEEQARVAIEQADSAEVRAAEARTWLRRMHECMVSEFGALVDDAGERA